MFEIRPANIKDSILILDYIKKLAVAEEFPFEVKVTKEDLEKNLFGNKSAAESIIFFFDKVPCGFAVYYFTFSTTTGQKGLHLDDLFIDPDYQGKGYGSKAMSYLAKLALKNDCARFEWWALRTNVNAIRFYNRIGAKQLDEISIFRLENDEIEHLAQQIDG